MMATATTSAAPPAGGGTVTGTGSLIRLILRRDRVRIPVWLLTVGGFLVMTAASLPDLYTTQAERQARARVMANPAAMALSGPGHGLDDYTIGAMLTNEMLGFTALVVAIMSVLLVVRHTRAEEEAGRAELVRASVAGRHAIVIAALAVVAATNVVLGALVAIGLGTLGEDSVTWSGSLLFGAGLASVGVVFATVAALAAQLTSHARGASGMAGLVIGAAYTLRAAGDVGDGTLSWLSPFGWAQSTLAFVDDRWWPLLVAVAVAAVLAVATLSLNGRRDVGAGLVRPRPGRAEASAGLAGPFSLALRLQRASLIGWGTGLVAFGLVYGTLVGEVERFVAELPALEEMLGVVEGGAVIDAFLAMIVSLQAMLCGLFVALSTMRLRAEEVRGRSEPVLATAVSAPRWVASHLAVAMGGGAGLLVAAALGLGVSTAATLGDAGRVPVLVGAALAYLPALGIVAGLGVALFGIAPRATAGVVAVVVYALTIGMLGGLMGLPAWLEQLSPFGHVPSLPAARLDLVPLAGLSALAAALTAAGVAGYRRRDLQAA